MQAFFSASETFIQLIGTGGTIAGHSADPSDELGYTAGVLPAAALLAGLPLADGALAGVAVRDESLAQIDSKNMRWDIWWLLARRVRACLGETLCRGVVIT
ncbi:MAG: asparaginase domain-containing protein, partial [Burkholderiaceae bacterium]|nr:asparaginase domain-containing protein [Burkholderiaceae bacterium]